MFTSSPHHFSSTGTGKTVVGIHIVYQFFMKNKDFLASSKFSKSSKSTPDEKPSKKPAILFCGPSNKSVDIVAGELRLVVFYNI